MRGDGGGGGEGEARNSSVASVTVKVSGICRLPQSDGLAHKVFCQFVKIGPALQGVSPHTAAHR